MASDSDGEEDFVTYGTPLEPLEEDEKLRKPIPIQDQTVKDEKGRFKRFHGAFTGGFSAGYFNTVGSKEGWAPSTFVSSRQQKADKPQTFRPEDFMDDEDFGEHGIAPREITTTDDFASGRRDQMRDKARAITSLTAPIPGDTLLEDLVAPARISVGVELLRKMGWKEGQGVGPRVKRKAAKQRSDAGLRGHGCALPPNGSEESEDEEDEYVPDDVTFAPKDVTPIDFTPKDDLHGLGYRGLNPQQALMGAAGAGHFNLFTLDSDRASSLLGDRGPKNRRRGGVGGQAFGVGALEEEDDDIYHRDALSNYDKVLGGEEPGDGLYGWTAPQQYRNKKRASSKDAAYLGKILEGFTLASKHKDNKTVFPPPELPRDFRPVHYFRPVVDLSSVSPLVAQALQASVGHMTQDSQPQGRHQLDAPQRRELLGESSLQGPSSVFDLLDSKDKERLAGLRRATEDRKPESSPEDRRAAMVAAGVAAAGAAAAAARASSQHALSSRFLPAGAEQALTAWSSPTAHSAQTFKPFDKTPHKQARYDMYISKLKQGDKDALDASLDPSMTEWERGRERDEFVRAAVLYQPSSSSLSSRFTRGKREEDGDTVEVPRDQEGDVDDKQAAVKMKMFGKLTRDTFEWHPDRLLCKRFNIPDPYPGSVLVGMPKIKRDKFSVFNFLTMTDSSSGSCGKNDAPSPTVAPAQHAGTPKPAEPGKRSRWDVSAQAGQVKDPLSEFLSEARGQSASSTQPEPSSQEASDSAPGPAAESKTEQQQQQEEEEEEEESRPPMDLFKAIFASSSDEKSSSSSEGESEDEQEEGALEPQAPSQPSAGPHLAPAAPPAPTSTPVTPTTTPAPAQPGAKAPPVSSGPSDAPPQGRREEEEEFGPRLPPPSYPWAGQLSSAPSSKEEKHKKKCKEKHKAKKGHKHRKDKKHKKKHKKRKHKAKQPQQKKAKTKAEVSSSSSDASADSGSQSDDGSGALSTAELLKRLKSLSGKKVQ
ncbi:G patch domain-containing protein 1 [Conger conger]|uniref:G patch domain-containing protein 1 n=1 Tax=Conger conger TaxID=82655 RepID=UPI002A5AC0BE|nr:G patch domain-containing protein 1 [Conger conger]